MRLGNVRHGREMGSMPASIPEPRRQLAETNSVSATATSRGTFEGTHRNPGKAGAKKEYGFHHQRHDTGRAYERGRERLTRSSILATVASAR